LGEGCDPSRKIQQTSCTTVIVPEVEKCRRDDTGEQQGLQAASTEAKVWGHHCSIIEASYCEMGKTGKEDGEDLLSGKGKQDRNLGNHVQSITFIKV
jgi:hypothetical protein